MPEEAKKRSTKQEVTDLKAENVDLKARVRQLEIHLEYVRYTLDKMKKRST